ncbi:MAG: hypothetical protein OQL09_02165 [Gammaproteobacteria bacterium]|nr:hypothetical protein [Gammaproteobacteria bacterium]
MLKYDSLAKFIHGGNHDKIDQADFYHRHYFYDCSSDLVELPRLSAGVV